MLRDYYEPNRSARYYPPALAWIQSLAPSSVLDVGGRRSPVLEAVAPSVDRACLDIERIPGLPPGVRRITADFATWTPDKHYDLVVCLQVLHAVPDPHHFAQKLFSVGSHVLLSIPYKAPYGMHLGLHANLDESVLLRWTGRHPTATQRIVEPGVSRLLALYAPRSAPRSAPLSTP